MEALRSVHNGRHSDTDTGTGALGADLHGGVQRAWARKVCHVCALPAGREEAAQHVRLFCRGAPHRLQRAGRGGTAAERRGRRGQVRQAFQGYQYRDTLLENAPPQGPENKSTNSRTPCTHTRTYTCTRTHPRPHLPSHSQTRARHPPPAPAPPPLSTLTMSWMCRSRAARLSCADMASSIAPGALCCRNAPCGRHIAAQRSVAQRARRSGGHAQALTGTPWGQQPCTRKQDRSCLPG